MTTPLLSVRDLHVHFNVRGTGLFPPKRTLKAVNGVTLSVSHGETLLRLRVGVPVQVCRGRLYRV